MGLSAKYKRHPIRTRMEIIVLNGKEYQLDIEQAKKLNLLKEKDNRVRSWEEFKRKYPNQFFHCTSDQLTTHEEEALAAFSKLLKLRRDWVGEWEPDWSDYTTCKCVIGYVSDSIVVNIRHTTARSLSFPTEQMAKKFLDTFRDLIEEAKILI